MDRLDPDATYLFMSNHASTFDIFALFVATEHPLRMVAKRVLFFIPIFGWSLWMCGFIPIDRSNRESAIRSLDRAARRIHLLHDETEEFYQRTRVSSQLCELRNLLAVAHLIVASAQRRTESRGLHFMADFPEADPAQAHDTVFGYGV